MRSVLLKMNFCLIIGLIFLVECSSAQYSYVYQIRHPGENKPEHYPNNEFNDVSQYRPQEQPRSIASAAESPKTRDFDVKSPEVGPTLLNVINRQNNEKSLETSASVWQSEPDGKNEKNPLILQSNTNAPIYARQPSPKAYSSANELPFYGERRIPYDNIQKSYPTMDSRDPREEQRKRDSIPRSYSLSYPTPSSPHQTSYLKSAEKDFEKDQKMRTVHSIQTPNYKIQLVSQPEPLEQLLPLLKQYQLSTKPFQYSAPSPPPQSYVQTYPPTQSYSPPQQSYSQPPQSSYSSKPDSGKALMVSVEPDARITDSIRHGSRDEPRGRSVSSYDRPLYEERRVESNIPKYLIRDYRPEPTPVPRPILDLPRQELPPQIQKLKSRPIPKISPPELRTHPVLEGRPQYAVREELVPISPVTALYQVGAPNLSKNVPTYSRVEYAPERDAKRDERPSYGQSIQSYGEEPVLYRIVERAEPGKPMPVLDLNEQLEKLRENPSAQKIFFDRLKSVAEEMPERSNTKYLKLEEQPEIASDPSYKASPIPEEYKPYTQTRFYKTYV